MILLYLQNCQNVNITQIRDTWTFFMDLSLKNDDHPVILQNNRSCPQSKHLAISALGVLHNSLKYIFFIRIGREFTCIFYWNYWTWDLLELTFSLNSFKDYICWIQSREFYGRNCKWTRGKLLVTLIQILFQCESLCRNNQP